MLGSFHNDELCVEAINLRSRKTISGRILSVYSKELGLLKLSGSKLGGRSEPFVNNLFWLKFRNDSEIQSIKASEFKRHFKDISSNLASLSYAWLFCELLENLSHFSDDKSKDVFNLFYSSLETLNLAKDETSCIHTALEFTWRLLCLTGYKPDLSVLKNIKSESHGDFFFDLTEGQIRENLKQGVKLLPLVIETMKKLDADAFEELPEQPQKFTLGLLLRYTEAQIGKKLKSSELL